MADTQMSADWPAIFVVRAGRTGTAGGKIRKYKNSPSVCGTADDTTNTVWLTRQQLSLWYDSGISYDFRSKIYEVIVDIKLVLNSSSLISLLFTKTPGLWRTNWACRRRYTVGNTGIDRSQVIATTSRMTGGLSVSQTSSIGLAVLSRGKSFRRQLW